MRHLGHDELSSIHCAQHLPWFLSWQPFVLRHRSRSNSNKSRQAVHPKEEGTELENQRAQSQSC